MIFLWLSFSETIEPELIGLAFAFEQASKKVKPSFKKSFYKN
jgi:hypothetical protein